MTTLPAAFGRRIRMMMDWWGVKPPPERPGLDDLKARMSLGDDIDPWRQERIDFDGTLQPHRAGKYGE
jgi:hypothetical protein